MRAAISAGNGVDAVRALARANGTPVLRDDGVRLVRDGVTTPEEVLCVPGVNVEKR